MVFNQAMVSSNKDDWGTDPEFFDLVNFYYNFQYDLAASEGNTKCYNFFSKEDNSLSKDWSILNGWLWCNPPYSRGTTQPFVEKAYAESLKGVKSVLLIPARPDTYYWHNTILKNAFIWFIRGKLKFEGAKDLAPFASALVEFGQKKGVGIIDKKSGKREIIYEL